MRQTTAVVHADQIVAGTLAAARLPSATDSAIGALETATQAEQETGTATDKIVTPGRQHFHPSAAKAWLYFSVSGGSPSIDGSFNIDSITDNGTGDWTVNIATDLSAATYAVAFASRGTSSANAGILTENSATPTRTAGTLRISGVTLGASVAVADTPSNSCIFFGDMP